MPDGKTHARYHTSFAPVVAVVSSAGLVYSLIGNSYVGEVAVWMFVWYMAGRYVDPDWDQPGVTAAEGRIQRELLVLAPPLLAATAFYASMIFVLVKVFHIKGAIGGSHRTWLTHSIVPGTVSRMAVICLGLAYVVNYATFLARTLFNTVIAFHPYDIAAFALGMFLGLAIADAIHIVLDNHFGGD